MTWVELLLVELRTWIGRRHCRSLISYETTVVGDERRVLIYLALQGSNRVCVTCRARRIESLYERIVTLNVALKSGRTLGD